MMREHPDHPDQEEGWQFGLEWGLKFAAVADQRVVARAQTARASGLRGRVGLPVLWAVVQRGAGMRHCGCRAKL